jgi:hypothetical protein
LGAFKIVGGADVVGLGRGLTGRGLAWCRRPHVRFQPGQPAEGEQDQGSPLDPPRAEPLEPAMAVTPLLRFLCPMIRATAPEGVTPSHHVHERGSRRMGWRDASGTGEGYMCRMRICGGGGHRRTPGSGAAHRYSRHIIRGLPATAIRGPSAGTGLVACRRCRPYRGRRIISTLAAA